MNTIAAHAMEILAAGFAALAAAHLFGIRFGSASSPRFPQGFRRVTGGLYAVAALLLALPPVRLFGVAIAAFALFLSATTLLHRRQYGFAASVIVALFALIPVSLAATV